MPFYTNSEKAIFAFKCVILSPQYKTTDSNEVEFMLRCFKITIKNIASKLRCKNSPIAKVL
jgi:hypothetical protein